MDDEEREARRKEKVNERIDRDVERVRARQIREEGRANAKAERESKREKEKASRKESANTTAKKVAKWAVGKTYSKTMGTYKPRISEGDVGNEYGGGGYNYNPYSGFGSFDYGRSFSGGFNGSFEQSPFSSGLRSRKRNMSWKPPRF